MSEYTPFGFEIPQGDPGAVLAAAVALGKLGATLSNQSRALEAGGRAALGAGAWAGPAASAFADYAGHVVGASRASASTCEDAATALRSFAAELAHAQSLTRQALTDCEYYQSELATQQRIAQTAGDAARTASQVAAAAPHPAVAAEFQREAQQAVQQQAAAQSAASTSDSHLHDAQRRGQLASAVYQVEAAALDTRLEAATVGVRPAPPLPGETSLGDRVNTGLGYGLSPWALLTSPPAALSGYRYLQAANATRNLPKVLVGIFDALDQVALEADALMPGTADVVRGLKGPMASAAVAAVVANERKAAGDFAARGGLPESPLLTTVGRVLGFAGVASDLLTIQSPGGQTAGEDNVNRIAAGANAAGTAAVLAGSDGVATTAAIVGINGATDWIPVAGEVVMVGTGLYLAGDWAYHAIKPFHDVVDATGRTLSSAGHDAEHFVTHDVFGLI